MNRSPVHPAAAPAFRRYDHNPTFYDEMFETDGSAREHCADFLETIRETPPDDLRQIQERVTRSFLHEGITFTVYGDEQTIERVFPIDCLPRIVRGDEWDEVARGLEQRLRALNLFLHDIYHQGRIIRDGVIPAELVYGNKHYRIEMRGIEVPHGAYVSVCGTDLVRTHDGFAVLEDNLRVPSGVSYMLACRDAIKRSMPRLFRRSRVRDVEQYSRRLLETLRSLAPRQVSDPSIVLLTPGVYNSAYYEHAFLARQMGIELVEGRDLLVHNRRVFMRTTAGLRQVDVIYRRIDDDFIDPLTFREDSVLGVPGLFHAYRAGRVVIANAPGTGIADDKAVYAYVPRIIQYYLGEESLIKPIPTNLCREREGLAYTLANLDKLVVKMVGESGGYGMLVGPHASKTERKEFAAALRENPENYISQPTLALSRAPCLVGAHIEPRHVDLRPFILQSDRTEIVPGGLCRVALKKGSLVVNSSQGGGSKDAWIVDAPEAGAPDA
jgi:uncharacterized circularly permuted ATP-grasp superfamily protein